MCFPNLTGNLCLRFNPSNIDSQSVKILLYLSDLALRLKGKIVDW